MSDPSRPDTDPGFTIPGYTDVRMIGRGGFSVVYYAMQTQFERVVAVKVLDVGLEDERTKRQYQRECAATGRLSGHPNIVSIIDSGFTSKHKPYLAMDYFSQGSLADRVAAFGPLPVHEVLRIGVKIAGALESAHQKDILHRDIKPENILVSGYGEPGLADFGIATVTARLQSSVTIHALTPNHAPPEVMEGKKATEVSDVYSLGSTLYELLAGRPAFNLGNDNSILAFLVRVLQEPVPPIPRQDVVPVVFDVLAAMMAKDPASRYQSAGAVGVALQQLQAHLGYPVTELVTFAPVPGALSVGTGGVTGGAPTAAPNTFGAPVAAAPPTALPTPVAPPPTAAPTGGGMPLAPAPAPAPMPVAPPPQGMDPSSYGLGGDATVLRPGALGPQHDPSTPGADPYGAAAPGSPGSPGPPVSPVAPGMAPPAPPPASAWAGDLDGSATVAHGRHAPVIESADLAPVAVEAGPSKGLRAAAIVVLLLLLAGAGFFGWSRLKGGTVDTGTGPTTTVAAGGQPTSPSSAGATDPSSPASQPGGPTTTVAGGTTGTLPPEAYGPPTDLNIRVTTSDSVEVTWRDPSGGKLNMVYQVLSPQGDKLTSKINRVTPLGATSLIVTTVDDGPLKTAAVQYCVAIGTIVGAGKPAWADAPCTDGTTVKIT